MQIEIFGKVTPFISNHKAKTQKKKRDAIAHATPFSRHEAVRCLSIKLLTKPKICSHGIDLSEINKPKNNRNEINLTQNKRFQINCASFGYKLTNDIEKNTKKNDKNAIYSANLLKCKHIHHIDMPHSNIVTSPLPRWGFFVMSIKMRNFVSHCKNSKESWQETKPSTSQSLSWQ